MRVWLEPLVMPIKIPISYLLNCQSIYKPNEYLSLSATSHHPSPRAGDWDPGGRSLRCPDLGQPRQEHLRLGPG